MIRKCSVNSRTTFRFRVNHGSAGVKPMDGKHRLTKVKCPHQQYLFKVALRGTSDEILSPVYLIFSWPSM